eukprot:c23744_g1_i1.p1 GENE.c23744_g1_i1~~c23744_g1_i1.p1  ORF type:complete len:376 (+),score=91.16 c23744_g1_i1:56-1183(+)
MGYTKQKSKVAKVKTQKLAAKKTLVKPTVDIFAKKVPAVSTVTTKTTQPTGASKPQGKYAAPATAAKESIKKTITKPIKTITKPTKTIVKSTISATKATKKPEDGKSTTTKISKELVAPESPEHAAVKAPVVAQSHNTILLHVNTESTNHQSAPLEALEARKTNKKGVRLSWQQQREEAQKRRDSTLPRLASLIPKSDDTSMTKYLALDCEMVGIGPDGVESVLASVCVVNWHGNTVYYSYAKPKEEITDYRTEFSGIRPENLVDAPTVAQVQKEVASLVKNHIIVGHGLENDFKVLMLRHPPWLVRDTAHFAQFKGPQDRSHKLKTLVRKILGCVIQTGEHDPAEDSLAALLVFKHVKPMWEAKLLRKYGNKLK